MEPSKERFQKINDLKVSRMKLDNDNKQVKEKQYEMFGSQPFPNIYLTSMKGGGKTNLIAFIVKNLITSKTKLQRVISRNRNATDTAFVLCHWRNWH